MQTGTIARLTDKGFGFIHVEGEEKDIFFHATEVEKAGGLFNDLREGDSLSFEVIEGDKGPQATNLVIGDGATEEAA